MGSRWSREKGMGKGNRSNCCYGWTGHPRNVPVVAWGWWYRPALATALGAAVQGAQASQHSPCPPALGATTTTAVPQCRVVWGLRHPTERPRAGMWSHLGTHGWAGGAGVDGEVSLSSPSMCPPQAGRAGIWVALMKFAKVRAPGVRRRFL